METLTNNWSVAVFAHNEADHIVACLQTIIGQGEAPDFPIHVLANGCTDSTAQLVTALGAEYPNVQLVTLEQADKAAAWNHYVHELAPASDCHFFVDGDIAVSPRAFIRLHRQLTEHPEATAAGGMPATGRTRVVWSTSMLRMGRLAGGLYALRAELLNQLRGAATRIPEGFIGEDLFVTCLAKSRFDAKGLNRASKKVRFAPKAQFRFEPLSLQRPRHWPLYFQRLVRYQLREHQVRMLAHAMRGRSADALPADVDELYRRTPALAKYRWCGWLTIFDWLAMRRIRRSLRKGL